MWLHAFNVPSKKQMNISLVRSMQIKEYIDVLQINQKLCCNAIKCIYKYQAQEVKFNQLEYMDIGSVITVSIE